MSVLLDVPYISQLGPGAKNFRNDCGAACGVMLVRAYKENQALTVDEYYKKTGQIEDEYLNAGQIMRVLASYQIPSVWRMSLSMGDVRFLINKKRPIIVLFNYGILHKRGINTHDKHFNGSHFAVLVGFDDNAVYINDPLWTGDQGKRLPIPVDIWMEAWDKFPLNSNGVPINPSRCAIVPSYPLDTAAIKPIQFDPEDVIRMRIIYPDGMNVRSGPGIDHFIVDSYNQGDIVTVLKTQKWGEDLWGCLGRERWVAIRYNGNTYLVPEFPGGVDDPKEYDVMEVISPEGLNVRSGKDITFPIVDYLMKGQRVKVYKKAKNGEDEWGRIGVEQWIAIKYQGEILASAI